MSYVNNSWNWKAKHFKGLTQKKKVRLINWESPKACYYHHQTALDFFLRQVFLMNCVLSEIPQIITVQILRWCSCTRSLVFGIQRIYKEKKKVKKLGNTLLSLPPSPSPPPPSPPPGVYLWSNPFLKQLTSFNKFLLKFNF